MQKILLSALILIIIGATGFLIFNNSDKKKTEINSQVTDQSINTATEISKQISKNGSEKYSSQNLGINFNYPQSWRITPLDRGESGISLSGDGYTIQFIKNFEKGFPAGVDTLSYKYSIFGEEVNVLEEKDIDGKFLQSMRLQYCDNLTILVTGRSGDSKEPTNKILDSLMCS